MEKGPGQWSRSRWFQPLDRGATAGKDGTRESDTKRQPSVLIGVVPSNKFGANPSLFPTPRLHSPIEPHGPKMPMSPTGGWERVWSKEGSNGTRDK